MAGRGQGPDFVEALARGLDVIACFGRERPEMSLSDVAQATGLARPTARRLLLTLEELGFVRSRDGQFALTPRVLSLGTAYVGPRNEIERRITEMIEVSTPSAPPVNRVGPSRLACTMPCRD